MYPNSIRGVIVEISSVNFFKLADSRSCCHPVLGCGRSQLVMRGCRDQWRLMSAMSLPWNTVPAPRR